MMKKLQNFLKFSSACLLLLFFLNPSSGLAQCSYGSNQYPFGSIAAPTNYGENIEITTCNYYGESADILGLLAINLYEFSADLGGFVTVYDASFNAVAFGNSPLSFVPPTDGEYFVQWNADNACGTGNSCVVTNIKLISPSSPCSDPAFAGTTISTPAAACPNQDFVLSLDAADIGIGMTYQWQSSSDGVTFTDIAGETNPTMTLVQSTNTYYQCIVTCAAGTPATSVPVLVVMNSFINCYCSSEAMYTSDEDIFNVSIGTLNNSSDCSTTGGGTSLVNQYSDYTADVVAPVLSRTVSYPLSIEVGTCGGNYDNMSKVFIDFDQNGTFDASEEVYVSAAFTNGPHTETGSVTIPLTATLGTTRMRVITAETSFSDDIQPCAVIYYGETEDYLVEIGAAPSCVQPTNVQWESGSTTTATISWTAGGTETAWEVEYGVSGFTIGSGTVVSVSSGTNTTLTALTPNTFYDVYVRAVCSVTDVSNNSISAEFNTFGFGQYIESDNACTPFIDITATGNNLNLTDDSNTGLVLPFSFFYQNSLVNNISVSNNGYVLLNTLSGTFGYDMTNSNNALYPFIQDLGTAINPAGVYQQTLGTAPNRKFIIQWANVPHYGFPTPTDGANFELVIDEATMEFYYLYDDVMMGDAAWDNGADAEIGIRGTQDIDVSLNNTDYLSANTCAHFFYTDCPKPTNLVFSNIFSDEFGMQWTAGPSGEGEWIIEYGLHGFTPGTGNLLTSITSPFQQIPNLTSLTTYDVYVYAACANGDTSIALMGSVQTKPLCTDVTGLYAVSSADTLFPNWNWSATNLPISGFNIQYGPTGFDLYSGTTVAATGTNFTDTIADAQLMAGATYDVYVQSVCGTDTSNFVGPVSIMMPLTNDLVCSPEALNVDGTVYHFNNNGATVSNSVATNQEQTIAPPSTGPQTTTGWDNSTISSSTWFTFQAPASGQVRISGVDEGYDGQMAVYAVGNCAQFSSFSLIAANDNEINGTSYAPNFTVCGLIPGNTYYLMHDAYYSWNTGDYSIKITPIVLEAGTATGSLTQICSGDTTNLFTTIAGNDAGGTWMPIIPSIVLAQDSLFTSSGLAYQTFQFQYRMVDGCAYDSVVTSIQVFEPSSAGNNGSLVVCRNQPFNLLQGLSGNVDLNGTWYNPSQTPVPNGNVIAENFPGQYNFIYIAGNNVCPNDTSLVIVSVQNSCNYLGLEESVIAGFSIYPNPTNGLVYLSFEGSSDVFNYEVLDLNGRKVSTETNTIQGESVTEINLTSVEKGIYMIHVFNENSEKTFRVVVK